MPSHTSVSPSPSTVASGEEHGLRCDIDRGPNWLIVRLHEQGKAAGGNYADQLWAICQRHFTYRLVVEMDEVASLTPAVAKQLDELRSRLADRGGALRLCGLSDRCRQRLDDAQSAFGRHSTRRDAVMESDLHGSVLKPH